MSVTYADVRDRLEEIDADLAQRIPEIEQAGVEYFHAKRNYELAFAREFIKAEGRNRDERESKALLALMRHEDYIRFVIAEAKWEGSKAAYRALETRASIGQSLLRVTARETGA